MIAWVIAPGNDRKRPLRRRVAEQRLCRVLDGVVAPRADGDPPWLCGLGQGKGQFQHAVVAVDGDVLPASMLDWDIVQLRRELDCESFLLPVFSLPLRFWYGGGPCAVTPAGSTLGVPDDRIPASSAACRERASVPATGLDLGAARERSTTTRLEGEEHVPRSARGRRPATGALGPPCDEHRTSASETSNATVRSRGRASGRSRSCSAGAGARSAAPGRPGRRGSRATRGARPPRASRTA